MYLPDAFLFDLDGVLLDTEDLHSQAWSEAAGKFKTKLDKQQLMLLKGRRRPECAELIIKWMKYHPSVEEFLKNTSTNI